ncbi:hypothetical protein G7066_13520 [Leucobacter coleopterorum]|uniref:DNA segregation ATPase FtsK/SpoIIIE, S-DNA-T family n=1 Tax=Leucobacter coleopterorum TaxID=2714933 RepID=A0ABX6JZJ9_9MICO|nr:DUF5684 domain-containing protein [Leucobacter coleopterorum]QIM19336.1 hypothetical protein G7066_13520 [Leucobacter coleopterorum]
MHGRRDNWRSVGRWDAHRLRNLGLVGLGFIIWYFWALSKLFPKLGLPASHGWIPIWNLWQLIQRGGLPGWLALFLLVPGLNVVALVVTIIAIHRINFEFGKGAGFTVLGAFLAPLWATMLSNHIGDMAYGGTWQPGAPAGQNGHLPYAVGHDGYGQPVQQAPFGGYQNQQQHFMGDSAAGEWQGMPPVQQDPVAGEWQGVVPGVQHGAPQVDPAWQGDAAGQPVAGWQGDPAWQVNSDQQQAYGHSEPLDQSQALPPQQSSWAPPPASGGVPAAPYPGAGQSGQIPQGQIPQGQMPQVPLPSVPPAPTAHPEVAEVPDAFQLNFQQPSFSAAPAPENNWGFSNTTEGAFERLASEGAPPQTESPLGEVMPPQELYSWPGVDPELPIEATAVTPAPVPVPEQVQAPAQPAPEFVPDPEPVATQSETAGEEVPNMHAASMNAAVPQEVAHGSEFEPVAEPAVPTIFETSVPPQEPPAVPAVPVAPAVLPETDAAEDSEEEFDHTVVVAREAAGALSCPVVKCSNCLETTLCSGVSPPPLTGLLP